MIDHIGLRVTDLVASKRFFIAALAPLQYRVWFEAADHAGLGSDRPDFWLSQGTAAGPIHICFRVERRALVDAFHAAALAAGGRDNGGPGLRPQYHPTYYGAFVFDPDGNNIEAVCHAPE
jgi:catechol 2,3-dioxygenase-like lactoylglutathione lyase family enzyme